MAATSSTDARETRGLWIAAGVVLAIQIALFYRVKFDDAYITFRYGANLARGVGLVFNPGERIMGSTSPGESLLAAVAYAIVGSNALPSVMASLGCVGWTLQAVFLFRILRGALGLVGASLVALAIAFGAAGSAPWVSLETNATCALTLLALMLALQSRWSLAAIACAAATMMRPDACLAALPLVALCVREQRRAAWKPAAIFVVLLLPWVIFAAVYFGTPLPQSATRKFQGGDLATFLEHAATYLPLPYEPQPGGFFAALVAWPLAIGGAVTLIKLDLRLFIVVAYGALHLVAYAVLRTDVAFQWHLYPAAVVFVVLVVSMLVSLESSGRVVGRLAAGALIAYGAWWTIDFAIDAPHRFWFGRRDALYRQIAAYVGPRSAESDILHAEEVGTLGYVTSLPMNDNAGLVTKDPSALLRQFIRHDPKAAHLRWLVLNEAQLAPMHVVFRDRPLLLFEHEGAKLWLCDLRDIVERP